MVGHGVHGGPRGQTEFQVNLKLGLTPQSRTPQSRVNLKLGLTPRSLDPAKPELT